VPDPEGVEGSEARMSAVEFQKAQRQLACWVHIGLQILHVRMPSLVILNRGVGRPVVSYGRLPGVLPELFMSASAAIANPLRVRVKRERDRQDVRDRRGQARRERVDLVHLVSLVHPNKPD